MYVFGGCGLYRRPPGADVPWLPRHLASIPSRKYLYYRARFIGCFHSQKQDSYPKLWEGYLRDTTLDQRGRSICVGTILGGVTKPLLEKDQGFLDLSTRSHGTDGDGCPAHEPGPWWIAFNLLAILLGDPVTVNHFRFRNGNSRSPWSVQLT